MYNNRIREYRREKNLQTVFILGSMLGLTGFLGWLLGGSDGLLLAILASGLLMYFSPRLAPHIVLRASRARMLSPYDAPRLYTIVRNLAGRAGLRRMPTLFLAPSRALNAFVVGNQEAAAIVITEGLLRTLNEREVQGVMAHEIAHISNNDLGVMAIADIATRVTGILSTFGQIAVLFALPAVIIGAIEMPLLPLLILVAAPTLAALLQLGLSRTREYAADLLAAELAGDHLGLVSALDKIAATQQLRWRQLLTIPWRQTQPVLLQTHPPTPERIARLLSLGSAKQFEPQASRSIVRLHLPGNGCWSLG